MPSGHEGAGGAEGAEDAEGVHAAVEGACAHCGLPVPAVEHRAGDPLQFCCGGCRAVHGALHECGLEQYYEMRERERAIEEGADEPALVTGRGFEHLDDARFIEAQTSVDQAGVRRVELRIDGLRCGACIWLLEAMPRIVRGVVSVRVDSARGIARIGWDERAVQLSAIARRFDALGYQLHPFGDPEAVARERAANRAWIVRMGVAGAIASNAMAVAFALYGGLLADMAVSFRLFFQWCSVALAVLAVAWPGRIFLTNAVAALRARTPHMDVPVAFGLVAAVGAGIVATVQGTGSIYCESAAMLVFLLLVGRYVQYGRQRRAREQVELLLAIVPSVARKVVRAVDGADGTGMSRERIVEVAMDALEAGDLVEIPANEACPADGRLVTESAHFDLSHLTGESQPVRVERGGPVYAGARVLESPARIEVAVAGGETRAARLLELVREAGERRAPIVELADRVSAFFLPTIVVAAAVTIAWWWPRVGADEAMARAVAMLVVTCPCALGLATPLAVVAGIGKGARRGVLVKGGDVLERASKPGTLVLDKTGTVTEGRTRAIRWTGSESALAAAAAVEMHSAHPIARAVVDAFGGRAAEAGAVSVATAVGDAQEVLEARDVRELPGLGIEARLGKRLVRVGSARFMRERSAIVAEAFGAFADGCKAAGLAPLFVSVDGRVEAVVAIGDPLRPDARSTVSRLRRSGWRVVLASGDDPVVAMGVAKALGIDGRDAHGGLSPEEKLAFVQRGDFARPVVMVGDGVNDLAALAAADVGVAVRNGAQASHHVADVCLAARGLRPLERFLVGARSTMGAIKVNLAVSVLYNAAGGVLAFAGLVNPLVAAVLMPLSGLTVLVLALRLPSFELPEMDHARGPGRGDGRENG
ncbi:MAG: heavy metal translocating P-type ATPase [Phycisphaerales bacterium]